MGNHVVLGIDAGGSKTLVLVAGMDGQELGRAKGGPGNYHAVGFAAASAAITDTVRAALRAANAEGTQVRALCLGAAGVDRPKDRVLWGEWARQAFPGAAAHIVNDALLVLASAAPSGCCGLAIIAGTGSIVYGRDTQGRLLRAGGWGYLMGDEGSNYAIGHAALRAISRAADQRGPATVLAELVLKHWSLKEASDLVGKVYGDTSRHDIARLGRLVEAAADLGDGVATFILEEAGRELGMAASVVSAQLGLDGEIRCALAGAVLVRGPRVRASFLRETVARGLQLDPVLLIEEPALGAVQLALEEMLKT